MASAGKGIAMDNEMTDFQVKLIINMVLQILDDSKTIDEAKEKIEALLNK